MSLLPQPSELDGIAARIARQAVTARARSAHLGASIALLDWHGVAADAFRGQAAGVVVALRVAAGQLDDAAEALRRHARAVGGVLDSLAGLGADGLHLARDAVLHPGGLAADGRRLVGDALHGLHGLPGLLGWP